MKEVGVVKKFKAVPVQCDGEGVELAPMMSVRGALRSSCGVDPHPLSAPNPRLRATLVTYTV